jgi:Fic family protein
MLEVADRHEQTALMEPMRLSDGSGHRPALADLALDLAAASEGFRRSLPLGVVEALAGLVREMNCYYSNLDVKAAQHVPVSPGAVPRFLARFEVAYGGLGKSESVLATAAAHHRLLWIHPFLDGNGRVARLMSHAVFLETLNTGSVWSIARGLARNESRYKELLAECDLPRRNDLDGRGNLSEEALAEFTRFFLETCLDQVRFMEQLAEPNRLRDRMLLWVEEEVRAGALPAKAGMILEAVLFRGELLRGEVSRLLGTGNRQARRVVAALLERGVLVSESQRARLFLAFPASLASRWMPGLFPPQAGES